MKSIYLKISIISLFFTFSFVNAQTVQLKRYYSYSIDKHVYTTKEDEVPPNSRYEGVLCYVHAPEGYTGGGGISKRIYLLIKSSNGDRLLTTSEEERSNALSLYGYVDGGYVGYTYSYPSMGTAIYRYNNPSKGDHFYTNDYNELKGGNFGYVYEQTLSW